MKTVAYIRVSTDKQDLKSQKLALLEFCQKEKIVIDEFQEVIVSSRKQKQGDDLKEIVKTLSSGDLLIVSEISRIGRSLGKIILQVNMLLERQINFIAVKENIRLNDGKQDMQTKVMISMFGLFAEIERDLISQRTKEGIKNARKKGKKIGRPKGKKGKSKLDGKEQEIAMYLDKGIPKRTIVKLLDVKVSEYTLRHFIKTRNLEAGDLLKRTL